MSKILKVAMMLTLSLVVVGSAAFVGCSSSAKALVLPDVELYQYLKSTTVDFDDATLNSMAEGSGEPSFKYGTAYAMFKSVFDANRDTVAVAVCGSPYKYGDTVSPTTYAQLTSGDKTRVDGTIFATMLTADNQTAVTNAVNSFFSGYDAQVAAGKPLVETVLYQTLKSKVTTSAANGWKSDVEKGVLPRQAFYRWLAKEGVAAMAGAAPLIQLSEQEFYFKVTNPNKYDITLDSLDMTFQVKDVKASASSAAVVVDAAKVAFVDKIWVPAKEGDQDGELIFRILAPVKTLNVITYGVVGGKTTTEAGTLAAIVFSQIQAGTAKWVVTMDASVSDKDETETLTNTYTFDWPAA